MMFDWSQAIGIAVLYYTKSHRYASSWVFIQLTYSHNIWQLWQKTANNNCWSNYWQVKSDDNNNNTEYPEKGYISDEDVERDFGEFHFPDKRGSPPRIPNFNDEFANVELINLSLERDIAWVLLSAVGNNILEGNLPIICIEDLKAIGSWTAFSKEASHAKTVKFKLEYLPVVLLPSHDNILKWCLDNIVQITEKIWTEEILCRWSYL